MSDTENINMNQLHPSNSSKEVTFLKSPNNNKILKEKNDDRPSPPQIKESSQQQKFTVEYERMESFQIFETICPLEFFEIKPDPPSPPKTVEIVAEKSTADEKIKSKDKPEKNKKYKKTNKGLKSLETLDSDSDDEFNEKCGRIAPKKILINVDAFFRSENPKCDAAGEGTVFWARGYSANVSSMKDNESDESDLDPEIEKYIKSQKQKKKRGDNLTGESLWYDQQRSIIRNLHENGSISLTSYGDTDERIFGKTEIFDSIMTPEERAMLRPRNPVEEVVSVVKPEKKKRAVETIKRKVKKQSSRPKDQGDWV